MIELKKKERKKERNCKVSRLFKKCAIPKDKFHRDRSLEFSIRHLTGNSFVTAYSMIEILNAIQLPRLRSVMLCTEYQRLRSTFFFKINESYIRRNTNKLLKKLLKKYCLINLIKKNNYNEINIIILKIYEYLLNKICDMFSFRIYNCNTYLWLFQLYTYYTNAFESENSRAKEER